MRVLLAGFIYGSDYANNFYFVMQKLVHGFARNGHCVQTFNDRDVARQSNPFRSRKLGVKSANRRLLDTCRNYRPHLVVLGHCDMIANETLAAIRDMLPESRIVYRNVDALQTPANAASLRHRLAAVDAAFVTTAGEALRGFAQPGARLHYIPNPVDAAVDSLQSFARTDQRFDLLFAFGSDTGSGDVRVDASRKLRQHLPEMAFEVRGLEKPPVRGMAYFDLLADSRMGLSLNRYNEHYLYSSDRMAQYTGNGLLTFVRRSTGFTDLYREEDLGFFDGIDELVDKLTYYRANDSQRRAVAEAGWRKSHRMFDSARVARFMEDIAFDRPLSHDYDWPVENHGAGRRV